MRLDDRARDPARVGTSTQRCITGVSRSLLLLLAVLLAFCITTAAQAQERSILIRFDSLVIDDEDDPLSCDEPYLIVIGFRMRLNLDARRGQASIVPNTLRVWTAMTGQNNLGRGSDNWADEDVRNYTLPWNIPRSVWARFPRNESGWVVGAFVVHMEEDGFPRQIADFLAARIKTSAEQSLRSLRVSPNLFADVAAALRNRVSREFRTGIVPALIAAADPDDIGGVALVLAATGTKDSVYTYSGPPTPNFFLSLQRMAGAQRNFSLRYPMNDLSQIPSNARFQGIHTVNGTIHSTILNRIN